LGKNRKVVAGQTAQISALTASEFAHCRIRTILP
jgi:hypothetical protein